jgi:sugar phosphate isomerase/epimerase
MFTRRRFNQALLAGIPASLYAVNSKFHGVQIGAISYSFRTLKTEEVLPALVKAGVGEVELMSNHAEDLAGGPSQRAREELIKWRSSVPMEKFAAVKKMFDDAGVHIELLCFNLGLNTNDEEIDYSFRLAKALGARAITCSTRISVAKMVAPIADKHKMMWAAHGHDETDKPNEVSSPETFAQITSMGKYMGINLDIGHFTAANYDPVAFIKENHAKITNLHLKDRKKNHGANLPWGEGDTPIKAVLQLLKTEKYPIPANVEYEYKGKDDPVTEVARCVEYAKEALA